MVRATTRRTLRIGATAAALLVLGGCARAVPADGSATVVAVVDGDTIDVRIGGRTERVRLIGVDTPETVDHDSPVDCFGPEATAFTSRLLPPGTTIRIVRDRVGRDDYGRLLGYVYAQRPVDRDDDGWLFVNLELIRRGMAVPLTIEPNSTYAAEFAAAARQAEAADVGLWAHCAS